MYPFLSHILINIINIHNLTQKSPWEKKISQCCYLYVRNESCSCVYGVSRWYFKVSTTGMSCIYWNTAILSLSL